MRICELSNQWNCIEKTLYAEYIRGNQIYQILAFLSWKMPELFKMSKIERYLYIEVIENTTKPILQEDILANYNPKSKIAED